MLSQDTTTFYRSLRNNIKLGKLDAIDDRVIEATRKADAHEFFQTLADSHGHAGCDAFVGERGVRLPGGRRQRMSNAAFFSRKSLLWDAPIPVLDEAT